MTFRALGLGLVLVASTALAQRITLPNFTGPGAATVRNQLVSAVCDSADCVTASKTTTGNKPDWKKAKKESVLFFVTGAVTKKGKALSLDLAVFNKAGAPRARRVFPLDANGTLAARQLQQAVELLSQAFAGGAPKNEPPEAPAETPAVAARPPPSSPSTSRPTASNEPAPAPAAAPSPAPAPTPAPARTRSVVVIDVGADVTTRQLKYEQVATPNLREYSLPPTGQPTVGVQFFPLALLGDGAAAGLGIDAAFAFAPWIQSQLQSAATAWPTSTLRLDAGLRFDWRPLSSWALTLTPWVGFRMHSFTVSPVNGARIDGLPDVSYTALRAGLMFDVPLVPGRLSFFGRFLVIPVLSSGEIISSAFFANGSTFGLEANGGLGVWFTPWLQLRASFEFINYGLTFKTTTSDPYVAAGAVDRWLGGNAALRFAF